MGDCEAPVRLWATLPRFVSATELPSAVPQPLPQRISVFGHPCRVLSGQVGGPAWSCPFLLLFLSAAACGQGWAVGGSQAWKQAYNGVGEPGAPGLYAFCRLLSTSRSPACAKPAETPSLGGPGFKDRILNPCKALAVGSDFLSPPSSILTPPAVWTPGGADWADRSRG